MREPRLLEAARQMRNTECVRCGAEPLYGGLRCSRCLEERRQLKRAGIHVCERHEPTYNCYQQCGCRCADCSDAERKRKGR